ncbi:hypothetical protein [Hafnia paralvei]|uniref:hypothetical protein n=1 Tax=Hafnia paralvei TaxID=546367 RepID=UPI0039B10475
MQHPDTRFCSPVFSFPIAVKEPVNAILRQRSFSKAQRRMKIGYVSIRHFYHHNYTATLFSRSPSLRLNGNWLVNNVKPPIIKDEGFSL